MSASDPYIFKWSWSRTRSHSWVTSSNVGTKDTLATPWLFQPSGLPEHLHESQGTSKCNDKHFLATPPQAPAVPSWFVGFFPPVIKRYLPSFINLICGLKKLFPKYFYKFQVIWRLLRDEFVVVSSKPQLYVDLITFFLNTPPKYNSCKKTVIWANLIVVRA